MTINTANSSVSPRLVRHEFRLHHRMASLASEGHRFSVFERPIAAESTCRDEDKSDRNENQESPARVWVVQIQFRVSHYHGGRLSPPPSSLQQHANRDDEEAKHQERREDYVSENPDVWVLCRGSDLDEKQEHYAHQAGNRDGSSRETNVVTK